MRRALDPRIALLILLLVLAAPGPGQAVTLITPYVNQADMSSINEAFSVGSCNPWGFTGDHRGIDFFPTSNNKAFQAACAGTVEAVDRFLNMGNLKWQVNVRIDCGGGEGVGYAFEPMSDQEPDSLQQLAQIAVSVGQGLAQGDLVGTLLVVGGGAHVHFDYYRNNRAICPDTVFTPGARASILAIMAGFWPHPRICYGLPHSLPEATITLDGDTSDWTGITAEAGDWQNDDSNSPAYDGDDIQALYLARNDTHLFLRMDLWEDVNTSFGNGPSGSEGRYSFSIQNDGNWPNLYLSVAYDPTGPGWTLGLGGSNGPGTPPQLTGPQYVGVAGPVIEVGIPLSVIEFPETLTTSQAEVSDCCASPSITILDATHCVSDLYFALFKDGFELGSTEMWSAVVGHL